MGWVRGLSPSERGAVLAASEGTYPNAPSPWPDHVQAAKDSAAVDALRVVLAARPRAGADEGFEAEGRRHASAVLGTGLHSIKAKQEYGAVAAGRASFLPSLGVETPGRGLSHAEVAAVRDAGAAVLSSGEPQDGLRLTDASFAAERAALRAVLDARPRYDVPAVCGGAGVEATAGRPWVNVEFFPDACFKTVEEPDDEPRDSWGGHPA